MQAKVVRRSAKREGGPHCHPRELRLASHSTRRRRASPDDFRGEFVDRHSTVNRFLCDACATLPPKHRKGEHALKYTHGNDCSDDCTPGTERALSLWLHTQIQALLSVEGRRRRELRARQGCVPGPRSVNGACGYDANPATKGANGSALEGEDGSWICPARAWASQGRRELGNLGPMGRRALPSGFKSPLPHH